MVFESSRVVGSHPKHPQQGPWVVGTKTDTRPEIQGVLGCRVGAAD